MRIELDFPEEIFHNTISLIVQYSRGIAEQNKQGGINVS